MRINPMIWGLILTIFVQPVWSQQTSSDTDTLHTNVISRPECPNELLSALNEDLLKTKSALFIINYSSHPLGKMEFRDNKKTVKLNTPMRMNRITLVYIDSGRHSFHTMYQQKFESITYQPGEIFIGALTSRSVWPLPFSLMKEDEKGEFGPVLLHYLTAYEAKELLKKIKNKTVIVN